MKVVEGIEVRDLQIHKGKALYEVEKGKIVILMTILKNHEVVAFKLVPLTKRIMVCFVIYSPFSFLIDLNECSRDKYYCHQDASCTNYRGSFTCTCDQGYFEDGFECASMIRYKIAALHVYDEKQLNL